MLELWGEDRLEQIKLFGEQVLPNVRFFFQAEDGIRDGTVTGVQTCALPICLAGPAVLEQRPAGLPVAPGFPASAAQAAWVVPQGFPVPWAGCRPAWAGCPVPCRPAWRARAAPGATPEELRAVSAALVTRPGRRAVRLTRVMPESRRAVRPARLAQAPVIRLRLAQLRLAQVPPVRAPLTRVRTAAPPMTAPRSSCPRISRRGSAAGDGSWAAGAKRSNPHRCVTRCLA